MFIFDQLKREDRQLQLISVGLLAGMFILLAGLWYVQVVSGERYEESLIKQSVKTIRVPAIRGRILDRNGTAMSENQRRFNVNLYLEELPFKPAARYRAASNITLQVGSILNQPAALNSKQFLEHCNENPYVPFPIMRDLNAKQVAVYSEKLAGQTGIDLEIQPVRHYPGNTLAAHLLGYVQRYNQPDEDDEEDPVRYTYRLPDFKGKAGLEGWYDSELRGVAGKKQVLVNYIKYRQQGKDLVAPAEPGQDLRLTIDIPIQAATEKALMRRMERTRGAAIVMDVRNGDILAMASAPTYDPNIWINGISEADWATLNDKESMHLVNRAIYGAYPPGSIFKIITAFACLENGLDIKEVYDNPGEYQASPTARPINDPAGAGLYNFERAFYKSSNSYFINYGLKAGCEKLLEMGKRFHLGELTQIAPPGNEVTGKFPSPEEALKDWPPSRTANACIGQEITVTPIQMALMTAAVANGGKLFWPRVVSCLRSQETGAEQELFAAGRIRETIRLNPRHLQIVHSAMLQDTENPEATAYNAFHKGNVPLLPNLHVAGKTGTAQITYPAKKHITWFVSFAPFENPRYAVVVMVEDGAGGGTTCAPAACEIYQAIAKREQAAAGKAGLSFNDRTQASLSSPTPTLMFATQN